MLRGRWDDRAIGTFHAWATRDGCALDRDGEAFYRWHELSSSEPDDHGAVVEIMFGDGRWMLAAYDDLEFEE